MKISSTFEIVSLAIIVALLLFDVIRNTRKPKTPSHFESIVTVSLYAVLAIIFGGIIFLNFGADSSVEFFSGWLTEYSLSVDNLFVFILILSNFKVPKELQKEALGIGILIALFLRGIFIIIGAAAIEAWSWIFYIFGAFLIWTAIKLLVDRGNEEEYHENAIVRFFHSVLPMSTRYNGTSLRIPDKTDPKIKRFTPLLIVFISLGVTDLLFAFDSIPAIFGLTKDPFIVFTANVFALMGLQQLYFLLGNLVEKLVFLPLGLSIVLAFIGVKLIIEALHGSGIHLIPEVPDLISLFVILITIATTAAASVIKIKRDLKKETQKQLSEKAMREMPDYEKEDF